MTESWEKPPDTPPDRPENRPDTPGSRWPMPPQQPFGGNPPPADHPYPGEPYPGGYPPSSYYFGYGPGYGAPPARPRNGLGIASLVIAIVALLFVWSVFGGVILGAVAAALGFVARARVKRREADNGGVAVAGVVLGILAIVVGLAFIPIWVGLWRDVGGGDYLNCLERAGSDPISQQKCADRFRQHVENKFSITLTPQPPQLPPP